MDYFENDGIDNHQLVEQMVIHARGLCDAYLSLSEPLEQYLNKEYKVWHRVPLTAAIIHVAMAIESFSELMGVEVPYEESNPKAA